VCTEGLGAFNASEKQVLRVPTFLLSANPNIGKWQRLQWKYLFQINSQKEAKHH